MIERRELLYLSIGEEISWQVFCPINSEERTLQLHETEESSDCLVVEEDSSFLSQKARTPDHLLYLFTKNGREFANRKKDGALPTFKSPKEEILFSAKFAAIGCFLI